MINLWTLIWCQRNYSLSELGPSGYSYTNNDMCVINKLLICKCHKVQGAQRSLLLASHSLNLNDDLIL